ncbi:hypothetical protein EW146_g1948 [Bondarzewia mesenterica]|uniref:F-box domain-containing protein n=1 Tax=Bondarzewia mesenterica TaxID=1095465 RepID=A0A4S4M443_9AGAM|nr:hypothetical protein EW146_g1948 [Bondarzewia mesenterica]
MSISTVSLGNVPQEVLEHIAFFAATADIIGPPTDLAPLLLVNRRHAGGLSIVSNPHLYARIFAAKFDVRPVVHRLGVESTTAPKLAAELRRRFALLGRIRTQIDCFVRPGHQPEEARRMHEMLWTAYVMMLENDGLNERQLREFAHIDAWLRDYWFDPNGASCATFAIRDNAWPPNTELSAVAMWLFWFLLRPDEYFGIDQTSFRNVTSILKIIALGAHKRCGCSPASAWGTARFIEIVLAHVLIRSAKGLYGYSSGTFRYPVCQPAWVDYLPELSLKHALTAFAEYPPLSPPPLATPAILSYLSLAQRPSFSLGAFQPTIPLPPSSVSLRVPMSEEWHSEWKRCLSLSGSKTVGEDLPSKAFRLGSMEGIWEGLFTASYTEFTAYAALLSGAPPPTLHKSVVAWHTQAWRLREYHLLALMLPEDEARVSNGDQYRPLSSGDPLRAYLPSGVKIRQGLESITIQEPGRDVNLIYDRARIDTPVDDEYAARVRDVLITGEGHSAWGQFNLIGRIRPSDGFVSLSKEYVDGDRGKWLYRGYLVGDHYGNLAGRWRDTLSPAAVAGYEGCFFMGRRR